MKYSRCTAVLLFMLMAILCTAIFPFVVTAEAAELPMTIKPILPVNQKAGVTGYFDLQINSAEKQTIYIQIINNKSKDIVVNLMPTNAYTYPTGGIFYEAKVDSLETSLLDDSFALSKFISMPSEVTIKAKQTVKIPIEVTVPDMNQGTIMGGVLIEEKADPSKQINETVEKDTAKFKVITKTVFAIAIQLDLPEQAVPAFSFGKAGFNPVGPNVFIEMRNDASMIQREISGVYKLTDKGGEKLFEGKIVPMIMAPKTQINYPLPWNNPILEPGNYSLSITASVAGEEIIADRTFEIGNKAVEKYSEKANQPIAKTQSGTLNFIVITVVVVFGGFMFWLGKRKSKVMVPSTKVNK